MARSSQQMYGRLVLYLCPNADCSWPDHQLHAVHMCLPQMFLFNHLCAAHRPSAFPPVAVIYYLSSRVLFWFFLVPSCSQLALWDSTEGKRGCMVSAAVLQGGRIQRGNQRFILLAAAFLMQWLCWLWEQKLCFFHANEPVRIVSIPELPPLQTHAFLLNVFCFHKSILGVMCMEEIQYFLSWPKWTLT